MLITCCAQQGACEVQQLIFSNKTTKNKNSQVGRHTALMDQESKRCLSLILLSIRKVNELMVEHERTNPEVTKEGSGFNFLSWGETILQDDWHSDWQLFYLM